MEVLIVEGAGGSTCSMRAAADLAAGVEPDIASDLDAGGGVPVATGASGAGDTLRAIVSVRAGAVGTARMGRPVWTSGRETASCRGVSACVDRATDRDSASPCATR